MQKDFVSTDKKYGKGVKTYMASNRSLWSGMLQFGMVSIPSKLYKATDDNSISLNMVHKECLSRVKMPRICETCNVPVSEAQTDRAYSISSDKMVVLSKDELEMIPLPTTKIIKIEGFVEQGSVDPIYRQSTYYLRPEDLATRPFVLLRDAMIKAKVSGLALFAMRARERLVLIENEGEVTSLVTLHWPDEIRDITAFSVDGSAFEFSKEERQMADEFMTTYSQEFHPENYRDHYRDALMQLIETKLEKGSIPTETPSRGVKVPTPDFTEALRLSIESHQAKERKSKKVTRR